MSAFEKLLDLQAHDTHLDQLRHRRAALPERAELVEIDRRVVELKARMDAAIAARDEVAGRQTALERDLATSEARIAEIDKRMYSGEVSASRELTAMADEITSIKKRVSDLEDQVLAVLDEREPLDSAIADLDAERERLAEERSGTTQRLVVAEGEIDAEIAAEQQVRDSLASEVPAELASTYEKLRGKLDGIGAARLEGRRCSGCHLELPATEVDRLRKLAPDELAFCDSCGRILVRS